MINTSALILFFACWGSFLNVLAFRLVHDKNIFTARSFCPHCNHLIYWYDNIPLFSWLNLKRKCRHCGGAISMLYPLIEILSVVLFSLLYYQVPSLYFCAYFIFFSALITTIRSDLETMLISQYMTLFLLPIGFVCSFFGYLPITLWASIIGACVGYVSLWSIATLFTRLTGKQGLGEGDMDLLALIGAFTGVYGVWVSLLIGSMTGSVIGMSYIMLSHAPNNTRIPFGPFLALGAILFVLWEKQIMNMLLL